MDTLEILQKLAKGEITSEEAFELLKGKPKKAREVFEKVKFWKESIPQVGHVSAGRHVERRFPVIDNAVSLNLVKGKYTVRCDARLDGILIIGEGAVEQIDKSVKLFGKFEILIPKVPTVNVSLSAGSLRGEVRTDTLNVSVKSGSAQLKIDCQICNIVNKLGSISVSFNEGLKVLNVTNKLGSVDIRVPRSFNGVVNTSRKLGSISFSSDIIFSYSKFGKYIVGVNGDTVVNIVTKLGSVEFGYDTSREVDQDIQIQEEEGSGR